MPESEFKVQWLGNGKSIQRAQHGRSVSAQKLLRLYQRGYTIDAQKRGGGDTFTAWSEEEEQAKFVVGHDREHIVPAGARDATWCRRSRGGPGAGLEPW